jgi:heptosyltransferase-3
MANEKDIKNILIFRIGSLGDTLVSLPAFHLLKAQYPKSHFTLLTNTSTDGGIKAASSHQILMGSGLIDNYLEYPHGEFSISSFLRVIREIRQLKPSTAIYLMPIRKTTQRIRDTFFFILAGFWYVRGLIPFYKYNAHQKLEHREYYESEASRLIRSIGFDRIPLTQTLFSLNLQKSERDHAKKLLSKLNTPFIALSLGTKVPANNWGIDRWTELLEQLAESLPDQYALVCLGSKDEYEKCHSLTIHWTGTVLNLCGLIKPRESGAILEHASLFIGHDSGPLHLASCMGTTCVSIFSSRNKPGVWFPFGNEKNVFYTDVPCSNCNLSVCIEQKMACIRNIQATEVCESVCTLLANNNLKKISWL